MNPNPEIYGAAETWQNAYNAGGINSAIGTALKCGRIKIPNFNAPNIGTYTTSQLRTAVSNNKITANVPIDSSICAVGQGDKSPFKKIACHYYDEDSNTWYGPYITEIPTPVNMFPYETYSANSLQGINGGFTNLNFAPLSSGQAQIWSENGVEIKYYNGRPLYYNANWRLAPFTYYQLKSIVLQVLVNYTTNTTEPMNDAGLNEDHWIVLDAWKNSYNQYPIVGCKVRMISAYQISGENIGYYYYVGENNSPYRSAFGLGLNHPIKHNDTDTFLSYTTFKLSQIDSDVLIFNKCYNLGGWGKYSKLCLPMWDKFSQYLQKPSNRAVLYRIPYSDTVYEELMQAVASLGFCFTPTGKTSFNVNFTDADLCIPVIDENGITTGEYTRGSDNTNNDLYNADSVRDKGYNPDTPPSPVDPNTYSNTSYFKMVTVGSVGCKRYALSVAAVNALMGDLWNLLTTFTQDTYEQLTQKIQAGMLVSNPIESIVSLLCFPFVIPNTGQDEPIKLGKYDMTARGTPVSSSTYEINFQGIPIFPRFGNCYLDYEPYTNYEVYVPFCGTIPLKAADILGHTLNVKLIVDLFTGSCTGYIMADSLVIETITGTVAITIPVTGLDSSTINSQIVNANLNYKSSLYAAGSTIGSMVSVGGFVSALSNPAETVNKIAQSQITEEKAQYDLTHIPTQPHMVGASSPALGWCCDTIARVMIYYPTGDVITDSKPPSLIDDKINSFGDLNGFSCLKWGKVREFNGFTLGNIKLDGVPCTESERARLKQLFSTGVYL